MVTAIPKGLADRVFFLNVLHRGRMEVDSKPISTCSRCELFGLSRIPSLELFSSQIKSRRNFMLLLLVCFHSVTLAFSTCPYLLTALGPQSGQEHENVPPDC